MTWSRATAIAGSAVVTLACCRIRIVRGHREPPPRPETRLDPTARLCQAERHETNRTGLARAADEVRTWHQPEDRQIHRARNPAHATRTRRRGDRVTTIFVAPASGGKRTLVFGGLGKSYRTPRRAAPNARLQAQVTLGCQPPWRCRHWRKPRPSRRRGRRRRRPHRSPRCRT